MSRCATCNESSENGCEDIAKQTDPEAFQKQLIETSEKAAGIKPRSIVGPEGSEYVPGNNRDKVPPAAAEGPVGPTGADVVEIIEVVVPALIRSELQRAGAIDANGKAILVDACLANCAKLIDERLAAFLEEQKDARAS